MQGAAVIYDLAANRVVRVLLAYAGGLRPLLWLEIGRDGSVYAGLSRASASVTIGDAAPIERTAAIRYADAKRVTDAAVLKKLHLSFHSSGAINAAGRRSYRSPWREQDMSKTHQLCLILFEHPSRFPPVSAPRKRDIVVEFPVAEDRPLQGKLFVAPRGQMVGAEKLDTQVSLVFDVRHLQQVPDLYVQVTLGHGIAGPWPPYTSATWAHKPAQ